MNQKTSRMPVFNQKRLEERYLFLQNFSDLSDTEVALLKHSFVMHPEINHLGENVVSTMALPFCIATNFLINNKDYLIPMVSEESSVVAAACHAAKLARLSGGFFSEHTSSLVMGQIVLVDVCNHDDAKKFIQEQEALLLAEANETDVCLVQLGGGARFITINSQDTQRGIMLVVQLYVDVKDAMGANIVNTMVEHIAPLLEKISKGVARLKIVSNLAMERMVFTRAIWSKEVIGSEVIEKVLDAYAFAKSNSARAVTHNKGIMNGISAVALATGNDSRALEAGAHGFAAQQGGYRPLTQYHKNERGDLVGSLEMPLSVGIVGGMIKSHPIATLALKILGVRHATELAQVMGAVGLAQNFAALRALVTEGIQKGHMKCHSRNIALQAGASGDQVGFVAQKMIQEQSISVIRAQELLKEHCHPEPCPELHREIDSGLSAIALAAAESSPFGKK